VRTPLDSIWGQLFPAEQQRVVRFVIDKVIISFNDLKVRFRPNGIEVRALELQPEPNTNLPQKSSRRSWHELDPY
jgi:site-specific DNA recombinase